MIKTGILVLREGYILKTLYQKQDTSVALLQEKRIYHKCYVFFHFTSFLAEIKLMTMVIHLFIGTKLLRAAAYNLLTVFCLQKIPYNCLRFYIRKQVLYLKAICLQDKKVRNCELNAKQFQAESKTRAVYRKNQ